MIDKNYLKAVSCFNINEYDENFTKIKIVQFKKDDDLNNCLLVPCHYLTFSEEIAQTIKNTPSIEVDPNMSFPIFEIKTFGIPDSSFSNSIIQRTFFYGEEWRRWHFNLHGEIWGEWINIDNTVDYILNSKDAQKDFIEKTWNQYMIVDENNLKKRTWSNSIIKTDEIIKQIKTGTAKIYRNKSIKT